MEESMMDSQESNRREFLATVGAAGAASILSGSIGASEGIAAEGKEKLAIDGGTPVRKGMLGSGSYGTQFYDDVEKNELLEVLASRSPFRRPGGKVAQFEQAYAAHIGEICLWGHVRAPPRCTPPWRPWKSGPATR